MNKSERTQLATRRHESTAVKYFALGCLFMGLVALLCISFHL
jgi:hypothetical protein